MLIWCCQNFHLICSAQQQTHLSHEEGKVEWVTEQSHLRCGNRSSKAFKKKKNIVRSSSQTESSWFLLCMSSKYLLSRQMDCGDRTLWHRGRHKQFPKQDWTTLLYWLNQRKIDSSLHEEYQQRLKPWNYRQISSMNRKANT